MINFLGNFMHKNLGRKSIEVAQAGDGVEGLKMVSENLPDIISSRSY